MNINQLYNYVQLSNEIKEEDIDSLKVQNNSTILDTSREENVQETESQSLFFRFKKTWSNFTLWSNRDNTAMQMEDRSETSTDPIEKEAFNFNDYQEAIQKEKDQQNDIFENTLFWRLTEKDLDQENALLSNKPIDLTVGIVNGELCYTISKEDLRPIPGSPLVQVGTTLALGAAALGSYKFFDEGIVTKGLLSGLTGFIVPKLTKIPYLSPILGPVAATTGIYLFRQLVQDNFYLKFSFVTGLGLCAVLYKRSGKGLATGGWHAFKNYLIPIGITENKMSSLKDRVVNFFCSNGNDEHRKLEDLSDKEHKVVCAIPIKPIHPDTYSAKVPVQLELSVFDSDMYYTLVLGDKKLPPVRMSNKAEEDDEDDDIEEAKQKKDEVDVEKDIAKGEKKKKKKKKEKSSPLVTQIKDGSLFMGSAALTALCKYFYGEGIITGAMNTIFIASVKSHLRQHAFINRYGILMAASGSLMLVKVAAPTSFASSLAFMPLSVIVSLANKDIRDRLVNGKRAKNRDVYEVPLWMKKILNKFFGWKPFPIIQKIHPLSQVVENKNNGKLAIKFDAKDIHSSNDHQEISAVLKISGESLSGVYKKMSKKQQKNLHLARLKGEKLGKWAEMSFLVTSIGATLLASYLTKQYQLSTLKDATQIKSEKLGEGVVTNILNSIFVAYMKKAGKSMPTLLRDVGFLSASGGAVALERYLIKNDMAPFLFASIPISAFLGMLSKRCKCWVLNKPYGTSKGYLTTDFPTDEQISNWWNQMSGKISKL